jgi:hypothetical protein
MKANATSLRLSKIELIIRADGINSIPTIQIEPTAPI